MAYNTSPLATKPKRKSDKKKKAEEEVDLTQPPTPSPEGRVYTPQVSGMETGSQRGIDALRANREARGNVYSADDNTVVDLAYAPRSEQPDQSEESSFQPVASGAELSNTITPEMAVMPNQNTYKPLNEVDRARSRERSEFRARTDDEGRFIDKDSGKGSAIKNFLKGLGMGALQGSRFGFLGMLAGAATGGIRNTKEGNLDEQWAWENWHQPRYQRNIAQARQNELYDQQQQDRERGIRREDQAFERSQAELEGIDMRNTLLEEQIKQIEDARKNPRVKDVSMRPDGYWETTYTDGRKEAFIDRRTGKPMYGEDFNQRRERIIKEREAERKFKIEIQNLSLKAQQMMLQARKIQTQKELDQAKFEFQKQVKNREFQSAEEARRVANYLKEQELAIRQQQVNQQGERASRSNTSNSSSNPNRF